MNVKEELEVIKMWFETIRKEALTKRNANGVLISDSKMLFELSVKAKDAIEYIELLLKEE